MCSGWPRRAAMTHPVIQPAINRYYELMSKQFLPLTKGELEGVNNFFDMSSTHDTVRADTACGWFSLLQRWSWASDGVVFPLRRFGVPRGRDFLGVRIRNTPSSGPR